MDYAWLKTLHVLAAVLFVGNITVTALWKAMADRTRDPGIVAFGQRLVTLTDLAFTGPGAFVVLATGMFMLSNFGEDPFRLAWLAWGLGLFLVSAALWAAILVPVQIKQSRLARSFAGGGEIPSRYWKLGRIWMAAGVPATLLPLVNVYFMVQKPV